MERGVITNLFNAKLQECGGDQKKAGKLTAKKLDNLLKEDKIVPSDLRFDQLAYELIPDYDDLRTAETQDIALAVSSSQFPTISKVAINKTVLDAYQLHQEGLDGLVTDITATRTNEEYLAGFTDPEGPELRQESQSYQETNFGERDITIKMADFGRTISVTREAIFNDRTGQLLENARGFGEKGGQHRAKMIVQTLECLPRTSFKEATSASNAFIYKGTAVQAATFYNATNHTSTDGRVNINLVASNGLVDYTNVDAALDLFVDMKTPAGDEMVITPRVVFCHEKLLSTAWQVFNSDTYWKVAGGETATGLSTYHGINPVGPRGFRPRFNVLGSRYAASETTWYIGDPKSSMYWAWVWRPSTASLAATADKAFYNNIVMTYKFSYHGGVGHSDYSFIVQNTA
jgi:hypothetical protein